MALLPTAVVEEAADQLGLPKQGWRRRRLAEKLHELAEYDLPLLKGRDPISKLARVRNTLARIEQACENRPYRPTRVRRLMKNRPHATGLVRYQVALSIEPEREETALFTGRADTRLQGIIESEPETLGAFVRAANACVEAKIKLRRDAPRHKEDETFKDVIRLLGDVYWEVTGKIPATSVSTKGVGGRFIQFLLKVLPHLDDRWKHKTPDALHSVIYELKYPKHAGSPPAWKGLSPKNSPSRFLT